VFLLECKELVVSEGSLSLTQLPVFCSRFDIK